MAWKKPDEELDKFLEETLASYDPRKRKMFGCPVFFVNDKMLAGVFEDNIFIRLSEKDRNEITSSNDEVTAFEPMKGRKMKEYIVIPESIYSHPEEFNKWLDRSYQYVSSLPKAKKKK